MGSGSSLGPRTGLDRNRDRDRGRGLVEVGDDLFFKNVIFFF